MLTYLPVPIGYPIFQYSKDSDKPKVLGAEEIEAGPEEAELLRCPVGQRWFKVESTPMVHIHAFVPPAYAGFLRIMTTRREPMYTSIESVYGEQILEVEQDFRAVIISARQARILKVKAGSAGLYVIRHYIGGGSRLVLVTLSVYPADRFSYAMRLRYNPQSTKE